MNMVPIGCPETSVQKYDCMLHDNSEERRPHNKICKSTSFNLLKFTGYV